MPNAIVKNVLVSIILVVLCIVIGAQAAESTSASMGIIIALVGGCFMLWLGPRSWVLLFLVPPVMEVLPLPGRLAEVPVSYIVGLVICIYWFIMWGMGYVKYRWRGYLPLDIIMLLMFCYMVASYVRYPVSMAIFGYDSDYVGGKEYIFCILAAIYYLTVSTVDCEYKQIVKVLKWAVRLSVVACLISICMQVFGIVKFGGLEGLQEEATGSRFMMFAKLSQFVVFLVYGMNSMLQVLISPFRMFAMILSCVGILISGWREQMMASGCLVISLSYVKRELWCMILVLFSIYGVILYLSKEEILQEMPYGIQRSVSILPGVKISDQIIGSATHSSEWRIEMWRWALDPRTGYIRDYTWGDGFGISTDYLRRQTTALMRGVSNANQQEMYAITGKWHNGAIAVVHRLGYVGLGLVTSIFAITFFAALRVCRASRGTALYLPSLFLALPYTAAPAMFYISAGSTLTFMLSLASVGMVKFMYCVAREQGLIVPWMLRQRYVPLAIQEHENMVRPSQP